MKIIFLGAAGTVTGSKYEIQHQHTRLLIDCGLYQGEKALRERNWSSLENAAKYDGVILTHAHIDHSGYLPRLVADGFNKRIHSTKATFELCKILLIDSAKLQEEDAVFANRTKHGRHFPAEPLYSEIDALKALQLFVGHDYNQWINVSDSLSFRFIRNGHILGSACVQIRYTENDKNRILTFTGDLGSGRSLVIKDPEKIVETDYLVSESTYGDRILKNLDENELANLINRVYKRQGTLIIPAFSVGRTQELLYIIKKLQKENKISTAMPIYLDSPMATKASVVYSRFPDELKLSAEEPLAENFFHPVHFYVCESPDESMLLCMSDQPKIVLSASGMLQGGRVLHHLKAKLPDAKSAVLFTGYQGQGTKGLLLKGGLNKIRIHHQPVDVEAEIVTLDSLSAHADSDELMNFYRAFNSAPAMTFLTHGEANSLGALQYRIKSELNWPCTIPELNSIFNLS